MFFHPQKDHKERGFTLIELLVVILIIGVLAAIAIPMFLNQRESAIEASLESDLKNAATVMDTEMLRNDRKYPSTLPLYDKQSDDNMVFLDPAQSSDASYCLTAKSISRPHLTRSYSSLDGGLLPRGKTCSTATLAGSSFQAAMAGKKALIVSTSRPDKKHDNHAVAALASVGITDSTFIERGTLTVDQAKEYDIVVLIGGAWAVTVTDRTAAWNAFNQYGISVLSDGNDSSSTHSPLIGESVSRQSPSGEGQKVGVTPTFNEGLTPSFPYTFKADLFNSVDPWRCPKTVTDGTIVIGDSQDPEAPGEKCLTMLGKTSPSGGRWVHVILMPGTYTEPSTNFTSVSLNWLAQK